MVNDDVLREVRATREMYASLHNYDVRAMVADLQARDLASDWQVVRLPPRRPIQAAEPTLKPTQSLKLAEAK